MFYDNFVTQCSRKNVSPSAVMKAIGLNKSSATYWKKGSMPSSDTLQKLANYFGCTVGYLLDGHRRLGDMAKEWKSNKAARLYMCIDSGLLDLLEKYAEEDGLTMEDEIEKILYAESENRLEDMDDGQYW